MAVNLNPMADIDRTTGIGASEASAIVGLNPWCGPDKLWKLKTSRIGEDTNDAMTCGIILEPYIREEVLAILKRELDRDLSLIDVPRWQPEPGRDWRRRSIDAVCPELRANVQIKTASSRAEWGDEWTDQIARYIKPQIVHEMSWPFEGWEFDRSFVPVAFIPDPAWRWRKLVIDTADDHAEMLMLVDQLDIAVFEVPREPWKERLLLEQEERFWRHVKDDEKPPEDFVDTLAKEVLAA